MIVEEMRVIGLNHYTEGPVVDQVGNVYCTTLTGGTILKIESNGNHSVWGSSACPNGQVILSNGDHLVCDSQLASVVRYNKEGVFLDNEIKEICNRVRISVPNDLVADETGGIYFTDSTRHDGKIFYCSNKGEQHVVATGIDYPNGIALSRNEKRLFVAESYKNRILAIRLDSPGVSTGETEIIAELPKHPSGQAESNLPDGIALDHKNQLWVAHYGMQAILVVSLDGHMQHSIEIPFPLVSNVCFSGEDSSTVIVTGGYSEPGPGAVCFLTVKY